MGLGGCKPTLLFKTSGILSKMATQSFRVSIRALPMGREVANVVDTRVEHTTCDARPLPISRPPELNPVLVAKAVLPPLAPPAAFATGGCPWSNLWTAVSGVVLM
jgi:hypothetical protein